MRERWLLVLLGLGVFAAAVGLARYGLDPSDEGYIVYSSVAVAAGQVPYRDLNSLYTPLSWYVHAALFKLVGVDLFALRVWFSLIAAMLCVGVYVHARQLMSPALAVLPLLSFVLLFPVPQNWAPYPAWYALGGLLIALLALGRWAKPDQRRARWLVASGLGCAVAFACKSNLGLLGLIACCGFLLLRARDLFGAADRAVPQLSLAAPRARSGWWLVQVAFVLAGGAALWLVVRGAATPGNQLLLVLPVLVAGLLLVERDLRLNDVLAAVRANLWVVLSFVVATLPWYVALSLVAGWQTTFDSVFVAGARTAWAFYEPLVPPNRDAIEGLAWIIGSLAVVGLFGWLARRGRLSGTHLVLAVAALLGLVGAVLVWRSVAEHQPLPTYLADNLWARWVRTATAPNDLPRVVPFLAELGGIYLLARRCVPSGSGSTVLRARPAVYDLRLALLVWFCVLFAFQLYPHASYLHVLFSWGPFLVLLGVVAAEVWRAVEPSLPTVGWRRAAFPLLAMLPLLLVPNAWRGRATLVEQTVPLQLPAAEMVQAKTDDAARLRMVEARTASLPPDAPVFAYPEAAMVYVLTGHPNPTRENYLATGYVDQAGQQAIVDRLEATRTRYVVWDREGARRLESNAWYTTLTDYLRSAYNPVAEQDDWLLMERTATLPNAGSASSGGRRRRSRPGSPG